MIFVLLSISLQDIIERDSDRRDHDRGGIKDSITAKPTPADAMRYLLELFPLHIELTVALKGEVEILF